MSKKEAENIFKSFFGDKEEIYLDRLGLEEKDWSENEEPIKKKDIINPYPKLYITVRKILAVYRETGNFATSIARYNCFLMLRAIMDKAISDIKYSDWLGKYPILEKLDNEVIKL
jgi:hypothetical protein